MQVQLPPRPPDPPHPPNLPVPHILLFPLLPSFTTAPEDAVGGEPGCQWSWTTAWRPHRGPRAGGTLRGRPPQGLARALPRPAPHAPIPNVPAAGVGTGGRGSGRPSVPAAGTRTGGGDSGRPRTDGTGCGVLREDVFRGRDIEWICSECASI